jgi:hypothetical protein
MGNKFRRRCMASGVSGWYSLRVLTFFAKEHIELQQCAPDTHRDQDARTGFLSDNDPSSVALSSPKKFSVLNAVQFMRFRGMADRFRDLQSSHESTLRRIDKPTVRDSGHGDQSEAGFHQSTLGSAVAAMFYAANSFSGANFR